MAINYNVNVYTTGTYTGTPVSSAAQTTNATGSSFLYACQSFNSVVFTPTDSKGNAYSIVGSQQNDASDGNGCAFYLCPNGVGGAGHVFNLGLSASAGLSFYVLEITGSGLVLGSILDQFYGNTGLLGNPVTGPVTPTANNELVVSFLQSNGGSTVVITPTNGFTKILNDNASALMVKVVSGGLGVVQDADPGFTPSGGRTSIMTASFFPATGGGGGSSYYVNSALEF